MRLTQDTKKVTIDDIHEYLMMWYQDDAWSDLNMALDSGYTLMSDDDMREMGYKLSK